MGMEWNPHVLEDDMIVHCWRLISLDLGLEKREKLEKEHVRMKKGFCEARPESDFRLASNIFVL